MGNMGRLSQTAEAELERYVRPYKTRHRLRRPVPCGIIADSEQAQNSNQRDKESHRALPGCYCFFHGFFLSLPSRLSMNCRAVLPEKLPWEIDHSIASLRSSSPLILSLLCFA